MAEHMTIAELDSILEHPAPRDLLLDVRDEEDAAWHPQSRGELSYANIPFSHFMEDPNTSLQQIGRDRRVAVLCYKGNSSQHIANFLQEHGRNAFSVQGGMNAYAGFHRATQVYATPDFELWQIVRPAKGCLSYALISGGEALIVDASRYIGYYEEFARSRNARIVRTFDTHLHADHISGDPALAKRAHGTYHLHDDDAAGSRLEREAVPREFKIGNAKVKILSLPVPGHTLGSTALLIDNHFLISGDTLLPSSIGRPDLGDAAREWAGYLHDSLVDVLSPLPAETVVLPAHSSATQDFDARGLCTRSLGSLLAMQQLGDKAQFLDEVEKRLHGTSQPPSYAQIRLINLGAPASSEQIESLEVGMNKCALSNREAFNTAGRS